jgi:hypothetical protein
MGPTCLPAVNLLFCLANDVAGRKNQKLLLGEYFFDAVNSNL